MADYFDEFNGPAGSLDGHTVGGQAWSSSDWTLDGSGLLVIPASYTTAYVELADVSTTLEIATAPSAGTLVFGTSGSSITIGAAYTGAQCFVDFSTMEAYLQSTYNQSSHYELGGDGPWRLRLVGEEGASTIDLYVDDLLVISYAGAWAGSGVGAFDRTFLSTYGDVSDLGTIASLRGGAAPPPVDSPFWTSFLGAREIL